MIRALLALLACGALLAVETAPLEVLAVADGDTITVRSDAGPLRIRMLYLDTPESHTNQHGEAMPEGVAAAAALRAALPAGARVVLWSPGSAFEDDVYQRRLAVVLRVDGEERTNLTALQVRAGWSVYWRKYGAAPEPLHSELIAAQDAARAARAGAWATAERMMEDKANERMAPQKRRER